MEQLQEKALNINADGSCHVPWSGRRRLLVRIGRQAGTASDPRGVPSGMAIGNEQPDGAPGVHRSLGLALGRRSPVDMAEFDKIVIRTDYQYVVNTFDKAKFEWPGTRWTTRGGAPVANTTQWKELMRLVRKAGVRVEARWVKGHARDPLNKMVDRLAKQSARTPSAQRLGHQRVRRRTSPFQTELGSVGIEGRVIKIRIVTDVWLPSPHRCYRYKHEVTDTEGPYFQRVDQIHSEVMLSAGHVYVVRFNANPRNPWIEDLIEEIVETR